MDFNFNKNTKIYVAGHKGLIGSSFIRYFRNNNYRNIVYRNRNELDLTSKKDTLDFFNEVKPEVVILSAGKVGGIIQNRDFPADFIFENISIQSNVIGAAYESGVKKLIFFASSCMYPKVTQQPMKESQLFTGHLEQSSIAYAIAKYAGLEMCKSINQQNGIVSCIPVIPNSTYGPNDNFELKSSHVLSALIRRIHEAKVQNNANLILWGSGKPKREFIYVDDVTKACMKILGSDLSNDLLPINIGVGVDISIRLLANKICEIVGYSGEIEWDTSKPDGASRKILDSTRLREMDWMPIISLDEGLKLTYEWYLDSVK